MTSTPGSRGVLFVLASWRMDAPAGIERATAALAAGLAAEGHRPVIATAAPQDHPGPRGVSIERLDLPVHFPCDDPTLRQALVDHETAVGRQLRHLVHRHQCDTVVFTDALWGLGRACIDLPPGVRRVLAAHVLPHEEDMAPALARAQTVLVPSPVVLAQARRAGYCTHDWQVLRNALFHQHPAPGTPRSLPALPRVRVLARSGPEKGVLPLLEAAAAHRWPRRLEVLLAPAGFEESDGAQKELQAECERLARRAPAVTVHTQALPWAQVPGWLAGAAVVIVPSLQETFGLVALEAMSVGTPVIAYRVGNLPALCEQEPEEAELLVEPADGPDTLLERADALMSDPIAYERTSKAMYHLAQRVTKDYRPSRIAQLFVKAVS